MSDALNRDLRDLARRDASDEEFDALVEALFCRAAFERKALAKALGIDLDEMDGALAPLVEAAASK